MPDDDDLGEDPGKTENRGAPGAKARNDEIERQQRYREALERQRREQEERQKRDDD